MDILQGALVPPGNFLAKAVAGSEWDNYTNWDRLAALGITAVLFSVVYWVILSEDQRGNYEKDN